DLAGMLTSGEIMLFLDGLNEMGATGHRKTQKLREWMGSQPALRTIITCRTGDYTRELDLHLPTIVADVMTPPQIQAFARHYLGDNATSFLKQIMVEQHEERGLTWLAGTPYLLSALIAVFQSRGMLPRNAGTLFQALAQVVWEQPVLKQMPGWIPFAEMESAFAQLAHTMIHQDKPTDISLRRALLSLTGKSWWQKPGPEWMDLLWVAHHAHLIEIRGTQVRFYHRLIQEYFAAVKLREIGLKNVLVRPEFYLGRVAGKWDQVIIALCGLVSNVEDIVRYIMRLDPWLALDCIRSGIQVSPQAHEMLLNELLDQMLGIDWPVRRAAVRALGEIGDPAAIPGLVMNGLLDTDWPVRRASATALGQIGVPDVVSGLIEALQDQNQIVRQAAVDALEVVGSAAVPALVEKLPDIHYPWRSEWRICDYAADALKRIATRDALDALDTWRQTAAT
ncbi:MAG: HEAT repeat domain-containing protein, partial [Anaerolineae bacterium]|nr:HEAT repeat domain-containing protein [Anaerolineae bacterium]